MVKKFISVLLVIAVTAAVLSSPAFATGGGGYEEGIFNEIPVGDYKIVCTRRYPVPTMGSGTFPSYMYGNYGVIDKDGNFVVEDKYNTILPPGSGRALFGIMIDGEQRYGYFDESWQVVIEPIYTHAKSFSEGLAAVSTTPGIDYYAKFGYINTDGRVVIPFVYDTSESAKDGTVSVGVRDIGWCYRDHYAWGAYDTAGNLLEKPLYRHDTANRTVVKYQGSIGFDGRHVDNSLFMYPFLVDTTNNQPYIPVSYYTMNALGVYAQWSDEEGLILTRSGSYSDDCGYGESVMTGDSDVAKIFDGKIVIEGKKFSNSDIFLPLLVYKDMIYIPLEWWTGLMRVNVIYNWTYADGMTLNTKW